MIQQVTHNQLWLKGKPAEILNYIDEISKEFLYVKDFIRFVQNGESEKPLRLQHRQL
jgi:hypothetical protein